ncbi:MAG: succinate--CoA ligase subunit alpha [Chloroflexota bacterium]
MILLDRNTRGIVQGVTGRIGSVQTKWMLEYGTRLVAGVTPGKGGQEVHGLPVYDTVQAAVAEQGANASVIFVPAPFVQAAVAEALAAGLKLVVVVTEHVPVHDSLQMKRLAQQHGAWLLGPNCPGLLTPGVGKLGIMPGNLFQPGPVGVVGRSATLTYEVAGNLSAAGLGQSTAVGVGGDMVTGARFRDVLQLFEADPATAAVALVGEIGGSAEEEAAAFIKEMSKPVVALIAGRNAPAEKKLGHAGAIIRGGQGTPQSKVAALQAAGVAIADSPLEVARLLRVALSEGGGPLVHLFQLMRTSAIGLAVGTRTKVVFRVARGACPPRSGNPLSPLGEGRGEGLFHQLTLS